MNNFRKTLPFRAISRLRTDQGISTVIGVILMVFLVVALSAVISVFVFGLVDRIEKTAYIASDAELTDIGQGIQALSLIHRGGDEVYYENQSQVNRNLTIVRFIVKAGGNLSMVRTSPVLLSNDSTWSPGDRVRIFRTTDGYFLTNDISPITGAISFPSGQVGIRVIDLTHNQLITDQEAGSIGDSVVPSLTTVTTITTTAPTVTPPTVVTSIPTTAPTATTAITTLPTPIPPSQQNCVSCGSGESFSVGFTTEVLGLHQIRFKEVSSPQPNIRNWLFGDGRSGTGELIDHTFPAAGTYQITLTVKKNNSPCTCTLIRWITVN